MKYNISDDDPSLLVWRTNHLLPLLVNNANISMWILYRAVAERQSSWLTIIAQTVIPYGKLIKKSWNTCWSVGTHVIHRKTLVMVTAVFNHNRHCNHGHQCWIAVEFKTPAFNFGVCTTLQMCNRVRNLSYEYVSQMECYECFTMFLVLRVDQQFQHWQ